MTTEGKPVIPNVLALRYASAPMVNLWTPEANVVFERDLWIAVMEAQQRLGVNITDGEIADYRRVRDMVDLGSIRRRELRTRHDVKARIEEFDELAGHQQAHRGMTSKDVTDNVDQMRVIKSLEIIRGKSVAALARMARHALEWDSLVVAGRTHFQPAECTTVGKRMTNIGEEMLTAFDDLDEFISGYPLRGIKGAVGTQAGQLQLLGDPEKVAQLERAVAQSLGFDPDRIMGSVGQIYPRSLDMAMTARLLRLSAAQANFAINIRLMSGLEQMTEGFAEGRVGSTAMPWKMNNSSCERMNSFYVVLGGYHNMAVAIAGQQWLEGDVVDSLARRVILPDSLMATDGQLETFIHVMDGLGAYPAVVRQELDRLLPFISSVRIMNAACQRGKGREDVHSAIRDHAIAVAREMRQTGRRENDLLDRLATDDRVGLTREEIEAAMVQPIELIGNAQQQVVDFAARVEKVVVRYSDTANYVPEPIL